MAHGTYTHYQIIVLSQTKRCLLIQVAPFCSGKRRRCSETREPAQVLVVQAVGGAVPRLHRFRTSRASSKRSHHDLPFRRRMLLDQAAAGGHGVSHIWRHGEKISSVTQ